MDVWLGSYSVSLKHALCFLGKCLRDRLKHISDRTQHFFLTGEADDSSASVETEEKVTEASGGEVDEQKEEGSEDVQEEEEAADKEKEVEEPEQGAGKQRDEEAEDDSGILSDKERQNEEVNEKDNCSASSISSASSTLEREERGSCENGGSFLIEIVPFEVKSRFVLAVGGWIEGFGPPANT